MSAALQIRELVSKVTSLSDCALRPAITNPRTKFSLLCYQVFSISMSALENCKSRVNFCSFLSMKIDDPLDPVKKLTYGDRQSILCVIFIRYIQAMH